MAAERPGKESDLIAVALGQLLSHGSFDAGLGGGLSTKCSYKIIETLNMVLVYHPTVNFIEIGVME